MNILAKLGSICFSNAAILNEKTGLTRIRTANGWVYERFTSEDHVATWANRHQPENAE